MNVTLLTSHYACGSPERRSELERCLKANCELDRIETVVVFAQDGVPRIEHPKIRLVEVRRRPTWADVLDHANAEFADRACVVAHADVFFDETLAYLDDVDLRWTCLALRRRAADGAPDSDGRPFDALAFLAPLPEIKARFPLGCRGAEARLAHELTRIRFTLREVGDAVHANHVHHATETGDHPDCSGPGAELLTPFPAGPKVVGVGLQRTGTSSLRRALNILGIPTMEFYGSWFLVKLRNGKIEFDPSVNHTYFQGFVDSPVPIFFCELDRMFPNSKFVYTVRDRERWLDSVRRLFELKQHWDESPEGDLFNAFHELSYGCAEFDREAFGAGFDAHHKNVADYFEGRPDDLLILDSREPDKWEKLCGFLDRPMPGVPYPHANRSRFTVRSIWKLLTRRVPRPKTLRIKR